MNYLDKIMDTIKGIAPTIAGTVATTVTGNPVIGGVMGSLVRGILGVPDDGSDLSNDEAKIILDNPEMYLKLKVALQEIELRKMGESTKRIESVNATMVAESQSESKAQRGWRPFNGYVFAIALFSDYILTQLILACIKSDFVWTHVPESVYFMWSAILGVGAASRGIEKVAKTNGSSGILSTIKGALK